MSAADNARRLFAVILASPALLSPFILLLMWQVLEGKRVFAAAFVTAAVVNLVLAVGLWRLSHWVHWAAVTWLASGVAWFAVFAHYSGSEPSVFDFLFLAGFIAFGVWLARILWRTGREGKKVPRSPTSPKLASS